MQLVLRKNIFKLCHWAF